MKGKVGVGARSNASRLINVGEGVGVGASETFSGRDPRKAINRTMISKIIAIKIELQEFRRC